MQEWCTQHAKAIHIITTRIFQKARNHRGKMLVISFYALCLNHNSLNGHVVSLVHTNYTNKCISILTTVYLFLKVEHSLFEAETFFCCPAVFMHAVEHV